MLYAEHVPSHRAGPSLRIFSNVDSHVELDKFRCMVRAPSQAVIIAKTAIEREHLLLFGNPRDVALRHLPADVVHATPMDRVVWEQQTRPEVMKKYPIPFLARE